MHREVKISAATRRESGFRAAAAAIGAVAGEQRGLVSREQLLDLELKPRTISRAVADRHLFIVHEGVYAVGHPAISREAELLAGVLAGGTDALLSHPSAAELWELPLAKDRLIHVVAATHGERPGLRFHRCDVSLDERTEHKGIPVTTPERTIVDVANGLSVRTLERLIRHAEYEHLTTSTSLAAVVHSHQGARGMKNLRRALGLSEDAKGNPRSELERRFLRFLRRHCLPRPTINHRIALPGGEVIADCAWPEQRLILELDSRKAHANRHSFESDRARDRAVLVAGWMTIRITWRQLHDEPAQLAADIRVLLRETNIEAASRRRY